MFDRALSLILLAYFGTVPAVAQEVPKVHYEAYIEEQSGKVILREISEDAEAGLASPSPKTQFPSGEMAATDEKAYALFDDSGSIRGVYPAPLTGADKEKLFDSIEQGGTLSMVSWFGDKISLPTTEQIEAVVSEATNGALRPGLLV